MRQTRLASHLLALACLSLLLIAAAPLAAQDDPLRVAIKPLTPFVIEDDGSYSGFSIDLWAAIAEHLSVPYEYVRFETVGEVLEAVRTGQADVGIAGISITREREGFLDFSQPMFNAGLQIMTSMRGSSPGFDLLLRLFQPELLIIPLIMIVVVVLVGHVIWLVERRNPEFPDDYLPGVGEGIWWAASALIGGSDKMPRSLIGRVGAIVWVLTGIILVAYLTANLTAQNTVNQLQNNIRSVEDLPGRRIATVQNTTAQAYLREQGLLYVGVTAIEDAYDLLDAGAVDVIVYDSPVLLYYANTEGRGRFQVVGAVFARQDYGIALPTASRNRERIDLALLALIEDGQYDAIFRRWFGDG